MRMLPALVCLLVGCASANLKGAGGDDDDDPPKDAPDVIPPDAPDVPVTVTLSQTTSTNIAALNTVNCNGGGTTRENSYYRVFPLAGAGITENFQVESVSFGVETATAGAGTQTVSVRVGVFTGTMTTTTTTLPAAQLSSPIAAVDAPVANGTATTITTPISATIPPNSNLYVELFSADTDNVFFPGSNNGGETFPSFLRAPDCGGTVAAAFSTITATAVHLIISVTGTH